MVENKIERPAGTWFVWFWIVVCLVILASIGHTQAPLIALECPYNKQNAQSQPTPENCSALPVLIIRSWQDLRFGTGAFIHQYKDEITTVATAIVAIFTCTLWRSTSLMLRVTTRATEATQRSVELARQEFIATHRPRLKVRRFNIQHLVGGDSPEIVLEIVNYGATPGTITANLMQIAILDQPGSVYGIFQLPLEPSRDGGSTIAAGRSVLMRHTEPDQIHADDVEAINLGKKFLHVMGRIVYHDDAGAPRQTNFFRWYDVDARRFRRVDDPEYDYED